MITMRDGHFEVDGKPYFVYSGEMHYFRIKPSLWSKHLSLAREAGLNTVSSYIPWSWHEAEEGSYDFTGKTHPQKNLVGFLRKVREHGLKFISRVGPVSNAEMVNEGIPDWVLRKYPEVFVRGKDVTNLPHVTLLSYLNEKFQNLVERWYDQVLPIVRENQWPAGGVILVQLDNEIGMVHWLNKAADYSRNTEKLYRRFLGERYEDIKRLNGAYGTKYKSFNGIKQPASGSDIQNMNLLWDWMNFYQHYYALYFDSLFKRYRNAGLVVPVLANIPQFYDFDVRGRGVFSPMTTMMFRDFRKFVPHTVFGGAYQMRRLDYENFHDISITTEVVKMITSPGVPSICAELQTGIMRDRPRLYAQDVELNLKTSAAQGLNAVNCYMFSGGKNEPVFGAFGTYHEWQAPVTPQGGKRGHYTALAEFGSIIKTFGTHLSGTKKHVETAIGFYPPYYTTEYLTGQRIEDWEWKKMQLFYDGLARLLQLAHINYTFVDLQQATLEELLRQPSLWVFTLEFMDAGTQEKLAEYVRAGGKLILNPYLPEKDAGLGTCTVLADYLGVRNEEVMRKPLHFFMGEQDYFAQGDVSAFSADPSAGIIAKTQDGRPCGLLIEKERGAALLLGFGLNHMFDYAIDLVAGFARLAGVSPAVAIERDVQAVMRTGEGYGFLFLANYHDERKETRVEVTLPGEKKKTVFPKRGVVTLHNRSCLILPLNVPLASGDRIRYSTAEVLGCRETGRTKVLSVHGAAGTAAEIELVTCCSLATVDGKKVPVEKKAGGLVVRFTLNGLVQKVMVR